VKKSRIGINVISIFLFFSLCFNFSGCTMKVNATDLMQGIVPNKVTPTEKMNDYNVKITDFSIRLFKANNNTLISPVSVLFAIAVTANGADGETLEQIENMLGIPIENINLYLYSYLNSLPQGEKYILNIANSIWFTDDERFTVNSSFLQKNADYYSASIYQTPFNRNTCKDINNWISNKTDGMITKIIDKIPSDAVMYLVNGLAFEADWMQIYEKQQVKEAEFSNSDGTKSKAEFMHSTELTYLQDENAKGFMKYYDEGKYAFVAILPDENTEISDYISSLNGEKIINILSSRTTETVYTSIPKFESENNTEMSEALKNMGMKSAFDMYNADFSRIGNSTHGNIYISNVLHKTRISVREKGTKAGAVSVIEASDGATPESEAPKEIYLDRPFMYMIIDCENTVPLFIGTVLNM